MHRVPIHMHVLQCVYMHVLQCTYMHVLQCCNTTRAVETVAFFSPEKFPKKMWEEIVRFLFQRTDKRQTVCGDCVGWLCEVAVWGDCVGGIYMMYPSIRICCSLLQSLCCSLLQSHTLQHTAPHCSILHHTATHTYFVPMYTHASRHVAVSVLQSHTLHHTTQHCSCSVRSTLQHTATHCNKKYI